MLQTNTTLTLSIPFANPNPRSKRATSLQYLNTSLDRLITMAGAGIHPYHHHQWPPAPPPPGPTAAPPAAGGGPPPHPPLPILNDEVLVFIYS